MLKKYFDFINESVDLILESDVVYSNSFRKVLKKIGDDVSSKLLDIENKDLPVASNYFDISTTNDTVSFTPDRKIKDILDKNQNKWVYSIPGKYIASDVKYQYLWDGLGLERKENTSEPPTGTLGTIGAEIISPVSGKKFVKFVPDDTSLSPIGVNIDAIKISGLEDVDIFKLNRQTIKVGRGIKAILKTANIDVLDKDIELFVNKFKASIDQLNDVFSSFSVVNGDDIAHWYNSKNYYNEDKGQLGSSCMANVDSEFFDIYCQNSDRVSLIIYKDSENTEKIKGRALLWKLNDGKLFMDRVYTNEDSDIQLFRDYAKKNGIYAKYSNSSTSDNNSFTPTGETERLNLTVNLSTGAYDKYPYLDTLKYYTPSTGIISTYKKSGSLELEDTDGGYTSCDSCGGEGRSECSYCDGTERLDCEHCDGSGTEYCNSCEGSGRETCSTCDGSGNVENSEGEEEDCKDCDGDVDCSSCDGSGNVDCSSCDGEGRVDCEHCDSGYVDCSDCS